MDSFDQPLLGFRAWKVIDNKLYPFTVVEDDLTEENDIGENDVEFDFEDIAWSQGSNSSFCLTEFQEGRSYDSPHSSSQGYTCHCGYNAFFNLPKAQIYAGSFIDHEVYILGAIAGAGKTEIHRSGYRSEQAQILALLTPSDIKYESGVLDELAKTYRVPVFIEDKDLLEYTTSLAVSEIDDFKGNPQNIEEYKNSWRNFVWTLDSVDDEPSISGENSRYWYKDNLLHREKGPASDTPSQKTWHRKGEFYREGDQPSVIIKTADYICLLWQDGDDLHRSEGKPALIQCNSEKLLKKRKSQLKNGGVKKIL